MSNEQSFLLHTPFGAMPERELHVLEQLVSTTRPDLLQSAKVSLFYSEHLGTMRGISYFCFRSSRL